MTQRIICEKACPADVDLIFALIEDSRALLRFEGIDQWQDGNPSAAAIAEDVSNGWAHVLRLDGRLIGYFALQLSPEPSYAHLWGGRWLSGGSAYATLHRVAIAADARGRGFSSIIFTNAIDICRTSSIGGLRIDTHRDNLRMRHIIKRHGFTLCGIVRLGDTPVQRLAYEKLLSPV